MILDKGIHANPCHLRLKDKHLILIQHFSSAILTGADPGGVLP